MAKKKRINSRAKGASSEREFAKRIQDQLGIKLVRNLEQSRGGGADLVVDSNTTGPLADIFRKLAIELKRYTRVTPANIEHFWVQVQREAKEIKGTPILAYRANFEEWKVVCHRSFLNPVFTDGDPWDAPLSETVTLSVETFTDIVLLKSLTHL